jgi:hypothetical protein
MQDEPKQRGRKPIPEEQKKRSYTLSLTPAESAELEQQAGKAGKNPSQFVVTKLRLDKGGRP